MIVVVVTDTDALDLLWLDAMARQYVFDASCRADRFGWAARDVEADGHAGFPNHEIGAVSNDVAHVHGTAALSIEHSVIVRSHVELFEASAIEAGEGHFSLG